MPRRHLQFILSGPVADRIETLRRQWDPTMAARTPAHVSLVYPEECDQETVLVSRTLNASRHTPPFTITLGEVSGGDAGRGGVWYLVSDATGTWQSLRGAILSAPFLTVPIEPHITIVHPRTSSRGPAALAVLAGLTIAGDLELSEVVYTETDASRMRVLKRFPLLGQGTSRVVGAVLRRNNQILLCHRRADRSSYPNVWDLPGGHVERHESLERALSRELDEELGITPSIPAGGPWLTRQADGFELSVFVVDRWLGEPQNRATQEHDEVRWVSLADLPTLSLAHPSYIELLAQALIAAV